MKKLISLLSLAGILNFSNAHAIKYDNARTEAIGGTKICINDDAYNIIFGNPAGISYIDNKISIPDATGTISKDLFKIDTTFRKIDEFSNKYQDFAIEKISIIDKITNDITIRDKQTLESLIYEFQNISSAEDLEKFINRLKGLGLKREDELKNDIERLREEQYNLENDLKSIGDNYFYTNINAMPHLFLSKHFGVGYFSSFDWDAKTHFNQEYKIRGYNLDFENNRVKILLDKTEPIAVTQYKYDRGISFVMGKDDFLVQDLSVGINAKYIRRNKMECFAVLPEEINLDLAESNIENIKKNFNGFNTKFNSGWGFSTDVGLIYKTGFHTYVGAVAKNFIKRDIKYENEKDELKKDFDVGATYKPGNLILACDITDLKYQPKAHIGTEYKIETDLCNIIPRFGFNADRFSGGLGLRIGSVNLDYALTKDDYGKAKHFVGFSFSKF